MSRIGRKPIPIPDKVDVNVAQGVVTVKGPNGEMKLVHHPNMSVSVENDGKEVVVTRPNDERENRALHGLTRSLINNMVIGAETYFEKKLEIVGVGYQAQMKGKQLALQVGFANTILLDIPPTVQCNVASPTLVELKSMDKQAVGQFAAVIRRVRPPEPYKGKGVRYQGEAIRRKAGKAFAK